MNIKLAESNKGWKENDGDNCKKKDKTGAEEGRGSRREERSWSGVQRLITEKHGPIRFLIFYKRGLLIHHKWRYACWGWRTPSHMKGGGWINKIKHVQHCLHRNRWQEWLQQIPEVRCSAVTMAVVAAHIASSLCCHGHLCSGNNSSYPSNPASPTHPSPCLSISLRHWEP